MIVVLTILHGLLAITLIGAVTHQALSVLRTRPTPARDFFSRFRSVSGAGYANAVVVLYLITFAFGAYIYPTYVLDVKGTLADQGERTLIGVFQLKEHIAVIGLALLPIYWNLWKQTPLTEHVMTRRVLTTVIALAVWWNLVVGHLLNNFRGLT